MGERVTVLYWFVVNDKRGFYLLTLWFDNHPEVRKV